MGICNDGKNNELYTHNTFDDCTEVRLNWTIGDKPEDFYNNKIDKALCILEQIKTALSKLALADVPTISLARTLSVGTTFQEIYTSKYKDKIILIQNISSLTDTPNDLIIQTLYTDTSQQGLGLIVPAGHTMKLHVPSGGLVKARFVENDSYIVVAEVSF